MWGLAPDSEASRFQESRLRLRAGTGSLELLARDNDVALAHPLLDLAVWAAVARSAPRGGHLGRSDAMRVAFGPMLPDALLARPDKACFDEVFFHDHSRTFASGWNGTGVPDRLVDPAALREHWRAGVPQAQSFFLLQAAWLGSTDAGEQPVGRDLESIPAARPA